MPIHCQQCGSNKSLFPMYVPNMTCQVPSVTCLFNPFRKERIMNSIYILMFNVVKCIILFLLYFLLCMFCLNPFLSLLTNQIILKNIKACCVPIPPIFFLHISLICLTSINNVPY